MAVMERPRTSRSKHRTSEPHIIPNVDTLHDYKHDSDQWTEHSWGDRPQTRGNQRRGSRDVDYQNYARRSNSIPDAGVYNEFTPSPPPQPRPPSARRQSLQSSGSDRPVSARSLSGRPPSATSLNRYTPLPAIGSRQNTLVEVDLNLNHQTVSNTVSDGVQNNIVTESKTNFQSPGNISDTEPDSWPEINRTDDHSGDKETDAVLSFPALEHKVTLPKEPGQGENRLLLAVKLPDGHRIQRYFRLSENLQTVVDFAQVSAKLDFSNCELICDGPRRVFCEFHISLQQCGVSDRTVFHINVPDEE